MAIKKTSRLSLITTATLAALSFGGALSAAAETDVYKDASRPNGHARSVAAKRADMRACGAVNGEVTNTDFPKADACMRAHGWAIDHVVADSPREDDSKTVVHFDDLRKKPSGDWRGDAALQVDTRRCSPRKTLDYESWEFKQCMLGRGWQFAYTHNAQPPRGRGQTSHEKTWQEYDEYGALLTCHAILGGFGSACSNF
ncbi:MAG TPA: hypothetical protein VIY51_02215 [Xanthobacteraceae bacterium]